MSPEFGSTVRDLPDRRRDARLPAPHRPLATSRSRSSRRTPRSRACGTTPTREPTFYRVRSSSTSSTVVPVARRPEAAAGPRRAHRRQGRLPRGAADYVDATTTTSTRPSRSRSRRRPAGRRQRRDRHDRPVAAVRRLPADQVTLPTARVRARPRRRGDRRDHLLHQHLQPVGDGRRRPAGAKNAVERGLTRKPWVKTTLAPGSQGRHRLLRQGRPHRRTSRSSASTSSATAAPPASATPARCPRRSAAAVEENDLAVVVGALRQPQLRGPHQPRRQDELPRLAAAGRRLRAGRHDGRRPRRPSRSAPTRTATPSTCTTSGRPARRSQQVIDAVDRPRRCSRSDYADVFAGDERWQLAADARRATPSTGTPTRPTSASPRTSRACR